MLGELVYPVSGLVFVKVGGKDPHSDEEIVTISSIGPVTHGEAESTFLVTRVEKALCEAGYKDIAHTVIGSVWELNPPKVDVESLVDWQPWVEGTGWQAAVADGPDGWAVSALIINGTKTGVRWHASREQAIDQAVRNGEAHCTLLGCYSR